MTLKIEGDPSWTIRSVERSNSSGGNQWNCWNHATSRSIFWRDPSWMFHCTGFFLAFLAKAHQGDSRETFHMSKRPKSSANNQWKCQTHWIWSIQSRFLGRSVSFQDPVSGKRIARKMQFNRIRWFFSPGGKLQNQTTTNRIEFQESCQDAEDSLEIETFCLPSSIEFGFVYWQETTGDMKYRCRADKRRSSAGPVTNSNHQIWKQFLRYLRSTGAQWVEAALNYGSRRI